MLVNLFLCDRTEVGQSKRILVRDLNLEDNVETLKDAAMSHCQTQNIELVFCGNVLENRCTLQACGIRSGVTVHVLKENVKETIRKSNPICEADILHLVSAFKTATKNPNYRTALQRLSRPEVLENIAVATPGLVDDPVALAILQDPELLSQLCDANTVRRVVEAHPSLVEAAHYIVAVVHDEAHTNTSSASGYSYSLDALSDDEEMDLSQPADSHPPQGAGESATSSPITAAQLAAALLSATGSSSSSSTASTSEVITPEMFTQAMQQAMLNSPTPAASTETNTDMGESSQRLRQQLLQMNEIGLVDDAVNLQALQATDWNVQEAINLVLSGAIGDPESL